MSEINVFRCRFIQVLVPCAPLLGFLDRQLNELLIRDVAYTPHTADPFPLGPWPLCWVAGLRLQLPAPDSQTYPSPGVVMAAAVVCWPLTRRVKMPQNQGEMLHCALQITAPQLEQQCRGDGGAWAAGRGLS
uniref:HDC02636 n=1 Tax=Drosophila melanogaster TaxID=7227 RepID=Q6IHG0_DROME|nr:TPA_inf: HDC02636 [Drosophila melanogaster]